MTIPTPSTTSRERTERARRTEDLFAQAGRTSDPEERRRLHGELVLVNRRVAEAIASRYRDRGLSREDLTQVAYEGLTKAVARFEPGLGHNFLSYAVPTITGELRRHFRDRGWVVRPPRRIQELQSRISQTSQALTHDLGREPTDGELIDELDVDPSDYAEAVAAVGCFQPASLDRPLSDDSEATLGSMLPGEELDEASPRLRLAPVVRRLSERDRRILFLRFYEDQTQSEIGQDLGVTQMQVSRLLTRILAQLREGLEDHDDPDAG